MLLLLRDSNSAAAGALAAKVGHSIAVFNSTRLTHLNPGSGTKELWAEVSRLTKPANLSSSYPPTITATTLNQHYCKVSTDLNYIQPALKFTCFPSQLLHWSLTMKFFTSLINLNVQLWAQTIYLFGSFAWQPLSFLNHLLIFSHFLYLHLPYHSSGKERLLYIPYPRSPTLLYHLT